MDNEFEALSAYLDGELPASERRTVEARIQADPAWRAQYDEMRRIRTMLTACMDTPHYHGSLVRQLGTKHRQAARKRWAARAVMIAASLAIVFAATALLLQHAPRPEPEGSPGLLATSQGPEPANPAPEVGPGESQEPVSEEPSTMPPVRLVGTVLGDRPMAILADSATGTQKTYEPGDEICEGLVLQEVLESEVLLNQAGQTLRLALASVAPASLAGTWQMDIELHYRNREGEILDKMETQAYVLIADARGTPEMTLADIGRSGEGREADGMFQNVQFSGNRIQFAMDLRNPKVSSGPIEVEGQVSADRTTMECTGSTPADDGSGVLELTIEAKKLDDADAAHRAEVAAALAERQEELKALMGALKAYADEHEHRFPSELAALVPDYLPDASLFEDTETRTILYAGAMLDLLLLDVPGMYPEVMKALGSASSDGIDHYVKLEQACTRTFGRTSPAPISMLRATYTNPPMVAQLDDWGKVTFVEGTLEPAPTDEQMQASSQNNLKQFGIVVKMFVCEQHGYTPPGWWSTYPEYLTDVRILHAPADEPGSGCSYDYLLPGVHQETYDARVAQAFGIQGETDRMTLVLAESQIPLVAEKKAFVSGRRNVLFADGHVELISDDEWSARIEPYLNLSF